MNNEEYFKIATNALIPCLNDGYIITDDAIDNIIIDAKVKEPFATAMRHTAEWFNSQDVASMDVEEDVKRHVGAFLNLMTLLAAGDVVGLVDNWVLSGLGDE